MHASEKEERLRKVRQGPWPSHLPLQPCDPCAEWKVPVSEMGRARTRAGRAGCRGQCQRSRLGEWWRRLPLPAPQ